MATRLYFPSSGTAPLGSLAVDAQWEQSTGLVRAPTSTSKSNKALADSTRTWASASTQQWVWWQYQSPCMSAGYSWTTADTISMVIRGLEQNAACDDHLAYCVRVVSADGTSVRGQIGFYGATATEFTTSAQTRIHNARTTGAANFSSLPGDRIIVEVGLHGVTPSTSYTQTLRVGDPSATNDFALTSGLTTDLCPWVQLSRTVAFGNALMAGNTGTFEFTQSAVLKGKGKLSGVSSIQLSAEGDISCLITGFLHSTEGTIEFLAEGKLNYGYLSKSTYIAFSNEGTLTDITPILRRSGHISIPFQVHGSLRDCTPHITSEILFGFIQPFYDEVVTVNGDPITTVNGDPVITSGFRYVDGVTGTLSEVIRYLIQGSAYIEFDAVGTLRGKGKLIASTTISFSQSGLRTAKGKKSGSASITFSQTARIQGKRLAKSYNSDILFIKDTFVNDVESTGSSSSNGGNGFWFSTTFVPTVTGLLKAWSTKCLMSNPSPAYDFDVIFKLYSTNAQLLPQTELATLASYKFQDFKYSSPNPEAKGWKLFTFSNPQKVSVGTRYAVVLVRANVPSNTHSAITWFASPGTVYETDYIYEISTIQGDPARFRVCVDGVLGVISGKGKLSASTNITFANAGAIRLMRFGVCSSTITFGSSAIIKGRGELSGDTDISFSQNAYLKGKGKLSGSSLISFTNSGLLYNPAVPTAPISGNSDFGFRVEGILHGKGKLSGISDITFSQTAYAEGMGELAGISPVTIDCVGSIKGRGRLVGGSLISFSHEANLQIGAIIVQVTGLSSLTFSSFSIITGRTHLSGYSDIGFSEVSDIFGRGHLSGSIVTSATVTGIVRGIGRLLGITDIEFDLSGHIQGKRHVIGEASILFDIYAAIKYQGQTWGITDFAFDSTGNLRVAKLHYEKICGRSYITVSIESPSLITDKIDGSSTMLCNIEGASPLTVIINELSLITPTISGMSLIKEENEQCIY